MPPFRGAPVPIFHEWMRAGRTRRPATATSRPARPRSSTGDLTPSARSTRSSRVCGHGGNAAVWPDHPGRESEAVPPAARIRRGPACSPAGTVACRAGPMARRSSNRGAGAPTAETPLRVPVAPKSGEAHRGAGLALEPVQAEPVVVLDAPQHPGVLVRLDQFVHPSHLLRLPRDVPLCPGTEDPNAGRGDRTTRENVSVSAWMARFTGRTLGNRWLNALPRFTPICRKGCPL
jgi:hypothetical protein